VAPAWAIAGEVQEVAGVMLAARTLVIVAPTTQPFVSAEVAAVHVPWVPEVATCVLWLRTD